MADKPGGKHVRRKPSFAMDETFAGQSRIVLWQAQETLKLAIEMHGRLHHGDRGIACKALVKRLRKQVRDLHEMVTKVDEWMGVEYCFDVLEKVDRHG